jgi:hypothetical protein
VSPGHRRRQPRPRSLSLSRLADQVEPGGSERSGDCELQADDSVHQLRGRRLPGPPGSAVPRPSPLKVGREYPPGSPSSRPPFREGGRACEPGGAASLRAWRSWIAARSSIGGSAPSWKMDPGLRSDIRDPRPSSPRSSQRSTLTDNCELKTLWINFVVAGSPAHLHRRFAPLPSSLKGGRDSSRVLPTLNVYIDSI